MKKILAMLILILLLVSCFAFVGCNPKQEMVVAIYFPYKAEPYSNQEYMHIYYDVDEDVREIYVDSAELRSVPLLGYLTVDEDPVSQHWQQTGYWLLDEEPSPTHWHVIDDECVKLSGTYTRDNKTLEIGPSYVNGKYAFILCQAGVYELTFEINPDNANIKPRTIKLIVYLNSKP